MGHPRAGQMTRCYDVVCIHCESADTFAYGQDQMRAKHLARQHGWMKTKEGWTHRDCHKVFVELQVYA